MTHPVRGRAVSLALRRGQQDPKTAALSVRPGSLAVRWRARPPADDRGREAAPVLRRGISVGGNNYGIASTGDNASNMVIQFREAQETAGHPASGTNTKSAAAPEGHVFISYVREDSAPVDRLQGTLEASGVRVWRDTASLWPGQDWKMKIRQAITSDALVFIACFSLASVARNRTYQREELLLAITQIRQRRPDEPWLIPVRFDACEIPDLDLGAGRTLASIQRADLFGPDYDKNAARLTITVEQILGQC
jgi:TIR domain